MPNNKGSKGSARHRHIPERGGEKEAASSHHYLGAQLGGFFWEPQPLRGRTEAPKTKRWQHTVYAAYVHSNITLLHEHRQLLKDDGKFLFLRLILFLL